MEEKAGLIEDLGRRPALTGPVADAAFRRCGWFPARRAACAEYEPTWYRGETGAWIQEFPEGARVEIVLWSGAVDDEFLAQEDGVERLHRRGEETLPPFQRDLLSRLPGPRNPVDSADEKEEFITVHAWAYLNVTLLIGLKQGDTDTPVEVVASVRRPWKTDTGGTKG